MAGRGLKLWGPAAAIDRMRWEERIHASLSNAGFQRVYTPYIYKKDLLAKFPGWVRENKFTVIRSMAADEEQYQEGLQLAYLNDHRLAHLQIHNTEPHSYSELPLKYFEIVEDYRVADGKVSNDVAVLLTVVSNTASGVEVIEVCQQIDALEAEHMKIVHPVDMICGKEEAIKFTASTNTKEDSYLTLAKVVFRWEE